MRALFRSALICAIAAISTLSMVRAEPALDDAVQRPSETLPIEDVTDYPPDEQAVRDALRRPVGIRAERLPLGKVVQALVDAHGLNFSIDEGALRGAKFQGKVMDIPVSIQPEEMLESALEDMLDDVGLDYHIVHSCVAITSRDSIRMNREIRVYDVSPLIGHDASAIDVATLLLDAYRTGALEAKGQRSLLIVRHHRHGQAQVLRKLNKLTREEVRKVASSRARLAMPVVPLPPPPKLPKVTARPSVKATSPDHQVRPVKSC